MKDLELLERCPNCNKHLLVRESVRMEGTSGENYLVKYCSCADYPLSELCRTLPLPKKVVPVAPAKKSTWETKSAKKSKKLKKLLKEEE